MNEWDAMKTLDRYVLDYMLKKKMHEAAEIFVKEANIAPVDVAINSPDGFLSEWWSIFWDFYCARLQNQPANGEEAANATENDGQNAWPIPSAPESTAQAISSMLSSLLSEMPMPEMNQLTLTAMQPAIPNPVTNPETVTVLQTPIPNPAMNRPTVTVLQPPTPNPAMNQHAMVLMQPSSSIPSPTINQQAVGVGLMPLSSSMPRPAMNQPTMGFTPPPNSISINQQVLGLLQAPSSIPMNQQAMGVMQPPELIPMNQWATVVMQTPGAISPALYQQMVEQLPESLRGEPISILLAKMYEQECLRRSARDLDTKVQQLDAVKMNPMLASSSRSSGYLPQLSEENVQQWLGREEKLPVGFERSNVVVTASLGASQAVEVPGTGKNKGIQQIAIAGHHIIGAGLVSSGLRNQVSHSCISLPNQQQLFPPYGAHCTTGVGLISSGWGNQISCSLGSLPKQQQQFMLSGGRFQVETLPALVAQKSKSPISSASGCSHNPACHVVIDYLSEKDLQVTDDAQTASGKEAEKQASAVQIRPEKQQSDKLMQKNLNENVRKRKKESGSSAMDISLDRKETEKEKSMDEEIEAYFSQENDNIDEVATLFSNLQRNSSAHCTREPEGFSFKEVGSLHSSNNKLLSCHFSSSGKLLAGAGHEKKILLWNMENYSVNTVPGHSDIITDVRFRPNSTVFGTCSFDKTVLIWDAYKRSRPLFELTGHSEHVMSLDFHPRKMDLLCSCDSGNQIRFWNVKSSSCSHISEGAGTRGRFQPRLGDLLAVATGNSINLIDVETNKIIGELQGHIKDIRALCWNSSGQYIAAVSEDSARIWSINSGGHSLHAFPRSGNAFESCTFHPAYCQLLVIGSNKSIQLWNPTEKNRSWSYEAHEGIIAALTESPYTDAIGSASHDQWLKVWK